MTRAICPKCNGHGHCLCNPRPLSNHREPSSKMGPKVDLPVPNRWKPISKLPQKWSFWAASTAVWRSAFLSVDFKRSDQRRVWWPMPGYFSRVTGKLVYPTRVDAIGKQPDCSDIHFDGPLRDAFGRRGAANGIGRTHSVIRYAKQWRHRFELN